MALRFDSDRAWLFALVCALIPVALWQFYSTWQPPVDAHAFRQSQTALTAAWLIDDRVSGNVFSYETPVFGYPWKAPFEFPVFQAITAGVSRATGLPVEQSGRAVSALFWLASLIPIYGIYRQLGAGLQAYAISAIFLICSPQYLYWGRSILIESTAVFFGLCFLYSAVKAATDRRALWWLVALCCGLVSALVKVTTFPPFGLAAAGIIVLLRCPDDKTPLALTRTKAKALFVLVLVGALIVLMVLFWTSHADAIKAENPIATLTSSSALHAWNYGSLAQRLDVETWRVLFERTSRHLLGGTWVIGLMVAGLPVVRGRPLLFVVGLLALFIMPFLVFTNLHVVHDYYQFANGLWLLMALGLIVSSWVTVVPRPWGASAVLLVVLTQLLSFRATYYPLTLARTSPAMQVADVVASRVGRDDAVVVIGDEWSPELAFFSGLRCVYIPQWLPESTGIEVMAELQQNPACILGSYSLGAVVINTNTVPHTYRNFQEHLLGYLKSLEQKPTESIGSHRIYWIKEGAPQNTSLQSSDRP